MKVKQVLQLSKKLCTQSDTGKAVFVKTHQGQTEHDDCCMNE